MSSPSISEAPRAPEGSPLSLIPSILLSYFELLGIAPYGIINLPGAFIGQYVIEPRLDSSSARAATCAGGKFGPLRAAAISVSMKPA